MKVKIRMLESKLKNDTIEYLPVFKNELNSVEDGNLLKIQYKEKSYILLTEGSYSELV